jgi:hypothetical protein
LRDLAVGDPSVSVPGGGEAELIQYEATYRLLAVPAAGLQAGQDLEGALELVRPFPDGRLDVYPVSPRVNHARNEGVELTEPLHG